MENNEKFRIAVIGAGIHSETNIYPSLANHLLSDIENVGVCDLDEAKAKKMAAVSGCSRTYNDYKEMIREETPDGIIICLNAKLHPDIVIDCLSLGVPVLVEKAPAINVKQAKSMVKASRETGKIVQVAHQKRHGTAYNYAREITQNREDFGEIVQLEAKMHGMPVFPTTFSCLMEWQIHNIDLIRSFAGDIEEIAVLSQIYDKNKASLVLALKFTGGGVGAVGWGTYGGPGPFCERIEIIGSKEKGVIVENAYSVTYYNGSWCRKWQPDWNPNLANQSQVLMGYVGEIRSFVDCVKEGRTPSPSIEDGMKNLEALYEIAGKAGIEQNWQFTPSKF